MLDMIDVVTTTDSVATDFTPEAMDSQNELREAITNLWVAHANAKIAARTTNEELHAIRAKLGEQLHEMKQLLAFPGRDGQWSGFLRKRGIPRATADRLVIRHLQSLNTEASRLSEAIHDPTEQVQKLFTSVWPKIHRTLTTPQSLYCFIDVLTAASCDGKCRRITDEGILILKPQQADSVADSAGEHEAEPQSVLAQPVAGLDQELM